MNASQKEKWTVWGAVGAALAASACCTVPLLLVAMGMGGAWMGTLTAMESYRPFFIVIAVGLLAIALYYRHRVNTDPSCACAPDRDLRIRKIWLGIGCVATLGLIVSPWLIPDGSTAQTALVTQGQARLQHAVFTIDGMTCAGCTTTVAMALDRTEGVTEVHVTYLPPEAVIAYDPAQVTTEELAAVITNSGYSATLAVNEHYP